FSALLSHSHTVLRSLHSLFTLSIGSAIAALTDCMATVKIATTMAVNPAKTNIHHCNSIRYAKPCNHRFMAYQPTGVAMRMAMRTSLINSLDRRATTLLTEAPRT